MFLAPHGSRPVEAGSATMAWVPAPLVSGLIATADEVAELNHYVEAVYRGRGPFDLVILGRESFLWQMPVLRRLHGSKPVVLICRGAYINSLAGSEPVDPAVRTELVGYYRSCDMVVCIARHLVESIGRIVGHPDVVFLPNPIVLPDFDRIPATMARHQPRPGDPVRLLMAAQIKQRKRPLDALDIVRILAERAVDVHLTICGDGPDMPELLARIDRYGLRQRITVRQRVNRAEVIDELGRVETVLLCSDNEGRPRILQEAIAAGRAVVAYDNPGSPEVVCDWGADWPLGRMVPIGNTLAAADAIQGLAERMRAMPGPIPIPPFAKPADIHADYDQLLRKLVAASMEREAELVEG